MVTGRAEIWPKEWPCFVCDARLTCDTAQIVKAFVPLSEMFGYATDMRSMTQGRASYSMFFDHYTQVPNNIAQQLMKK